MHLKANSKRRISHRRCREGSTASDRSGGLTAFSAGAMHTSTSLPRSLQLEPACSARMLPTVSAIEEQESSPEVTNRLLQKESLSPEQTGTPGKSGRMPQSAKGFRLLNCFRLMPA